MTPTRSAPPGPVLEAPESAQFAAARAVADAVLFEGYLLYPYRKSSGKNRVRWQFGVLAPRLWITAQGIPDPGVAGAAESWYQQVECLLEAPPEATVRVLLRFLRVEHRQVYDAAGNPVDAAEDGERTVLSFDEGVGQECAAQFRLADLLTGERAVPVDVPALQERTGLAGSGGEVVRSAAPVRAVLRAGAAQAAAPFPLIALRLRVENTGTGCGLDAARDDALRQSLVATHLLLGVDRGHFLSAIDPPAWAAQAAATCVNRHVFPVLAGADDGADVMLCSPIILYDHPKIAPESPGDLHDATEIDEILSLRTLTLTEEEKREARATDPRAAAIVDRVDTMPPELLARLHGAVRGLRPAAAAEPDELPWWDPRAEAAVDPQRDTITIGGRTIGRGSVVRLRPRGRGSDAHDMFLAGRTATVHAVLRDVDGSVRVAVTVDGDPAADLHEWYGRFFHFSPEEVDPA